MRVTLTSSTPLRFADGTPVRAASGVARYGAGWLVVQDDATHALRVGVRRRGRALRLVAPVEGHDTFEEASGTKALKPDLEAVVALPDGRTLALGSGSTPARMRCVLLLGEHDPGRRPARRSTPGSPSSSRSRRTSSTSRAPPWSATRCGGSSAGCRPRAHRAPASTSSWTASSTMRPERRPRSGSRVLRRYDLGTVAGVGLAVTDAISLPGGLVLVSAAAEDCPDVRRRPGGRLGPRPARRRARCVDLAELPLLDGEVAKVEGLALVGHRDDVLDLVAVVDADDPEVPSLLLELVVER